MYPPPRNEKVGYRSKWHFGSGWCTLHPPRNWNWTKHECYRKKIISREVIKYILPIYPPFHYHYLILCLNRKMVNFNFKWIYRLEPHPPPSPAKKIKCSFLDYVQLLMISWDGWWTQTSLPPLSSKKNKMLIFGLHSTSDDWPGWSMDSSPVHHPFPAKKMKCLFLDYVQLLMISRAGR